MDNLPTEARPVSDSMPLHRALGPMQEPLLARTVDLSVGEPPQPVRLTVYGPAAATWASLQRIDQTLALAGAALVLLAVALCWLQVRVGWPRCAGWRPCWPPIRNPGSAAQEGALVDVQAMLAAPTGRDSAAPAGRAGQSAGSTTPAWWRVPARCVGPEPCP